LAEFSKVVVLTSLDVLGLAAMAAEEDRSLYSADPDNCCCPADSICLNHSDYYSVDDKKAEQQGAVGTSTTG
jgi:hypothetical protein